MNVFQKAITTVQRFFLDGPSPKIRDPQNGAPRFGSSAGVSVTASSALGVSAFFACLRLISSSIAALPLPVYRRNSEGIAVEARDSQLWKVLHDSPNADQTALDYMETVSVSLLMRGDHFARKLLDGKRLIGLEPVRPDIVTVRRDSSGQIRYRWSENGQSVDLGEDEMFHVRGFGGGPLGGLSVLALARESLGIAIAADRAAGAIFRNGVQPTGALKFKEWLDAEKREIARNDLANEFSGAQNAGRPMILEGGVEWEQITLKADDAQLLESRAWSVEDVCRWFGVPPILIGHSDKQTSWGTGVEQVVLGFLKFTLTPYLRRIEQSISKQLLTPAERAQGLFAEFNVEGLLRGDSNGRAQFYHYALSDGWMTRNEARAKENLEPVEGGDVVTIQSQNIALEEAVRTAVRDALKAAGPVQTN